MKQRICSAGHNNHDDDGTTNLLWLALALRGRFSAALAACDIDLESLGRSVR